MLKKFLKILNTIRALSQLIICRCFYMNTYFFDVIFMNKKFSLARISATKLHRYAYLNLE